MVKSELHKPVMADEVLQGFKESSLKIFFDGTLGAGGHAEALLCAHPEIELYIGCDQDPHALAIAHERLAPFHHKVQFVHSNHRYVKDVLKNLDVEGVDGFFLI